MSNLHVIWSLIKNFIGLSAFLGTHSHNSQLNYYCTVYNKGVMALSMFWRPSWESRFSGCGIWGDFWYIIFDIEYYPNRWKPYSHQRNVMHFGLLLSSPTCMYTCIYFIHVCGLLGAVLGLRVIWWLIEKFVGLIAFLDPENHSIVTKIIAVRCIIKELWPF